MYSININDLIPHALHFTWSEVLYLHEWDIYAYPEEAQHLNLIKVISKLEKIRSIFDRPIFITSGLRPTVYNQHIGGAPDSSHRFGEAIDFVVKGYEGPGGCDHIRSVLAPQLIELKIRMEKRPGSDWVHIDIREPGIERYFLP